MSDLDKTIGGAIRKARKRLDWTQEELAKKADFGSEQIISLIELGERPLKASELARLSRALFCDFAALLEDKPLIQTAVLWRKEPEKAKEVEAQFLQDCEHYRLVEELCGATTRNKVKDLPVQLPNDYEGAQSYGEKVRGALGLGKRPAEELRRVLEEDFGLKLFYEPELEGSAASAVGEFGYGILMNSTEPPWRRNYSLAHEVFHLLTWSLIPPEQLKESPAWKKKAEQMAENFASALVLPSEELARDLHTRTKDGKINFGDIVDMARVFGVSTQALIWRMVNMKWIERPAGEELLKNEAFLKLDRSTMAEKWKDPPPPYPSRFVHLAFRAWREGNLSKSNLAGFLHTNLAALPGRLAEYGLSEDEDYEATLPVG